MTQRPSDRSIQSKFGSQGMREKRNEFAENNAKASTTATLMCS
jgi:hypothetical protein